jgi:2-hydroxy-3-keto-5-methylthiopentenyl-1-phosphate phosphatase
VESQNCGCHLVSAEKSANDEDQPGVHTKTASEEDDLVSFVNDSLQSGIEVVDSNVARKYIGSTVDIDPPMEKELFESRQQLLNYCQSRRYQFDELRRAKYTTMMVRCVFRLFPSLYCIALIFWLILLHP